MRRMREPVVKALEPSDIPTGSWSAAARHIEPTGRRRAQQKLVQWSRTYATVERRLEDAGAVEELRCLRRMSQEELDLLVQLERGMGPTIHSFHTPMDSRDIPNVLHRISTIRPQVCASGSSHAGCGPVAHMTNHTRGNPAA